MFWEWQLTELRLRLHFLSIPRTVLVVSCDRQHPCVTHCLQLENIVDRSKQSKTVCGNQRGVDTCNRRAESNCARKKSEEQHVPVQTRATTTWDLLTNAGQTQPCHGFARAVVLLQRLTMVCVLVPSICTIFEIISCFSEMMLHDLVFLTFLTEVPCQTSCPDLLFKTAQVNHHLRNCLFQRFLSFW